MSTNKMTKKNNLIVSPAYGAIMAINIDRTNIPFNGISFFNFACPTTITKKYAMYRYKVLNTRTNSLSDTLIDAASFPKRSKAL